MELGSLADWFTGAATLSAVITTLLLNFNGNNKRIKRLRENSIRSILKLSDDLFLKIKNDNVTAEQFQNLQQAKTFNIYLMVIMFREANELSDIISIGEGIFSCLSEGNSVLQQDKMKHYRYLRKELMELE